MDEKLPVFNSERDGLADSLNELYDYKLTPEEKTEAKDNLLRFFELLIQIDRSNEEQRYDTLRSADNPC